MNIIASFPAGSDRITANGLHQWDWGRYLEIHDTSLPALVEVHFACPGIAEAIVRSCAVVSGVATAAIPDECIEQTAPITAWVVTVGQTSGETIRTITMPVIERARPEPSATIPTSISDRYTEAVAAMDAAVDAIEAGTVTAAKARADEDGNQIKTTYYKKTDTVTNATNAVNATNATTATNATNATNAATATAANKLNTSEIEIGAGGSVTLANGLYAVHLGDLITGQTRYNLTVLLSVDSGITERDICAASFTYKVNDVLYLGHLQYYTTTHLLSLDASSQSLFEIEKCRLITAY